MRGKKSQAPPDRVKAKQLVREISHSEALAVAAAVLARVDSNRYKVRTGVSVIVTDANGFFVVMQRQDAAPKGSMEQAWNICGEFVVNNGLCEPIENTGMPRDVVLLPDHTGTVIGACAVAGSVPWQDLQNILGAAVDESSTF